MTNRWIIGSVACVSWIILFAAVYTACYFWFGIEEKDALRNFGTVTQGVVAAKRPDEHNSVIYYFNVDGIQYTGLGRGGNGNPEFENLHVGDSVMVRYDSLNAFDSYMGDPAEQTNSEIVMAYLIAFVVSTAVVGQILGVLLIVSYIRRRNGLATV